MIYWEKKEGNREKKSKKQREMSCHGGVPVSSAVLHPSHKLSISPPSCPSPPLTSVIHFQCKRCILHPLLYFSPAFCQRCLWWATCLLCLSSLSQQPCNFLMSTSLLPLFISALSIIPTSFCSRLSVYHWVITADWRLHTQKVIYCTTTAMVTWRLCGTSTSRQCLV